MKNKYYSVYVDEKTKEASINIYGEITSWPWLESDVSSYTLSKEIEGLDVEVINVHLSSYGGEVSEGWAIYNALKSNTAKIRTIADGMVCSICAVIFAAGEERIMRNISLLMVHNAWTSCTGNADQLRKEANDLEKMSKLSAQAFMEHVNITEEELAQILAAETMMTPQEALDMGFATSIEGESKAAKASQSAKRHVMNLITRAWQEETKEDPEDDPEKDPETDPEDDPEKDPEIDPKTDPEDDPEKDPEVDPEKDSKDKLEEKKKVENQMSKLALSSFFNAISKIN